MPARLEDIKWNFKSGGIIYLTRDQWNLVMEKGMKMVLCGACGEIHELGGPCLTNTPRVGKARDPLLVEREKTHGSFKQNANTWNTMLKVMQGASPMPAEQSMALHMIFVKIARLVQNPNVKDHWKDLSGYALLGMEACEPQGVHTIDSLTGKRVHD